MKLLVCGGRDYKDHETLFRTLDAIHAETPISILIQGGAPGADWWAFEWATERHCPTQTFRADWEQYGMGAGPIRNQQMIDEGKPDLVVAFPGGRGTADMRRRAIAAGVRVVDIHRR